MLSPSLIITYIINNYICTVEKMMIVRLLLFQRLVPRVQERLSRRQPEQGQDPGGGGIDPAGGRGKGIRGPGVQDLRQGW